MQKFTFKDTANNQWDLELNLATHARLRKFDFDERWIKYPVSLVQPDEKFLEAMAEDAGAMFEVLYVILKPQIDKVFPGMSEEEQKLAFWENVNSDTITAARAAFFEAFGFFCQPAKIFFLKHSKLKKHAEKIIERQTKDLEPQLMARMEEIAEREFQKRIEELKTGIFGE